jgi:hypothetical protein
MNCYTSLNPLTSCFGSLLAVQPRGRYIIRHMFLRYTWTGWLAGCWLGAGWLLAGSAM